MLIIRVAFIITLFCLSLSGQVSVTTGELAGSVRETGGQAVGSAQVIAADLDRGFLYSSTTGSDGLYRISLLPAGIYRIKVEAPGYALLTSEPLAVSLGETVRLDAVVHLETTTFEATAWARESAMDQQRVQQAAIMDGTRIANLPLNRREYLDLALLSPGVLESRPVVDAFDYRLAILPNSGLSFAGSNGRGNLFTIDGIENSDSSGNVRPSLAQTAVREFQVNRNGYSADLGGAYGGAVNVVSRSGTNDWHGTLFGYLRHRSLQARNYFDPGKSAYTRVQSGADVGGPLRKDRVFFFAGFERLDRQESVFVPLRQDPELLSRLTPSQTRLTEYFLTVPDPQVQALGRSLQFLLTPTNNPAVAPLFARNSGVFPFSGHRTLVSVRLDGRAGRHDWFFRANGGAEDSGNTQFGALKGVSRGLSNELRDATGAFSDTIRLNSRWVSVTRAAWGYTSFKGLPNDPIGPETNIQGYGLFGRDSTFPYSRRENHYQVQQTFAWDGSAHSVRFGADVKPVKISVFALPFNGGRFEFGEFIPLSVLMDQAAGNPNFTAGLAQGLAAMGRPDLIPALYAPITSLQSYSLGLPVAYLQGFGDPNWTGWQKRLSLFVTDQWRVTRGLSLSAGLRFQGESTTGVPYLRNWLPRFGLAWSPVGASWVLRASYGMFSSFTDNYVAYSTYGFKTPLIQNVLVPLTGVPQVINPGTGQPVTSADIYQGLLRQGVLGQRPIELKDLAQFGIQPGFRAPTTGDLDPTYVSPYTHQASVQVERSFGSYTVGASYQFTRALHLPRVRDHNLVKIGTRPDGWPVFGRVNPAILNFFVTESTGNSLYHAGIFQVEKRLGRGWTLASHYTWSKAIDDVTDWGFDLAPHDQSYIRGERALSLFHQTHRLVGYAVYESPVSAAKGSGALHNLASDWTVSGIFRANSARPFNVLTGFDNLGDGLTNTHRPLGLGRNAGIGPSFWTLDFRLVRRFNLGREGARAIFFSAEGFNLANRTNFLTVNNVVGNVPVEALPSPLTGHRGNATDPLAFSSANDARQFQLGLRLSF